MALVTAPRYVGVQFAFLLQLPGIRMQVTTYELVHRLRFMQLSQDKDK